MKIELQNDIKPLKDFIVKEVTQNGCNIISDEWRSKYNGCVVYDYEPFCSDGFINEITIGGEIENIEFCRYIINKKIEQVRNLNNLFLNYTTNKEELTRS